MSNATMESGDIVVHKTSGTLSEITQSQYGFCLNLTLKYGNRWHTSKTKYYTEGEILSQWRYADDHEIDMYNRGKRSIT